MGMAPCDQPRLGAPSLRLGFYETSRQRVLSRLGRTGQDPTGDCPEDESLRTRPLGLVHHSHRRHQPAIVGPSGPPTQIRAGQVWQTGPAHPRLSRLSAIGQSGYQPVFPDGVRAL